MSKIVLWCASLGLIAASVSVVSAAQLNLSLEEIAQTADLTFIGTVTDQTSRMNAQGTSIETEVTFNDVRTVHATERSVQRGWSALKLTYAGGTVGDATMTVSDTPRFTTGARYLVFMSDDGMKYFNPIIGGPQGLFWVVTDQQSGQEYVLTAGKRAVLGVNAGNVIASAERVAAIGGGHLIPQPPSATPPSNRDAGAATAADPADSTRASDVAPAAGSPMLLDAFLTVVTEVALKTPIANPLIQRDGVGLFYHNVDGVIQATPIQTKAPRARTFEQMAQAGAAPNAIGPEGAAIFYCGYHDDTLTMEQVSDTWWEYWINNDSMWTWNQFVDLYRVVADDGSFGWGVWPFEGENEFDGYPSSAQLDDVYGFGWPAGALAITMTRNYAGMCSEILESDVAWNPAYSWTDDFNVSLGGTAKLQRPATMHELGHTWGEQRGDETYDYDETSVMHRYYSNVVEDGWGIHAGDAWLFRDDYDGRRPIVATSDIGVESYWASNGLNNAFTDATEYFRGDPITINNITVENMSDVALADVRIRFYLSTNKTITTGDYRIGNYWFWNAFCSTCYSVNDYVTTIPADVPPGTYWVGAIVTINGFGADDYGRNNAVFLRNQITVKAMYTLTVSKDGNGSGTVTSVPAGIDCGADCSESYEQDTVVTLTATPMANSTFTGWSGACVGDGDCTVTMTSAKNVTATFAIRTYTLTVSKAGAGWGTVTSDPAGINCGDDCSEIYELFTVVILTAAPAPNSEFTGWSGACSGTGDCILNMTGPRNVTATFALKTWMLSVSKAGGGNGSVTSAPTGINCGTDCAEPYPYGTAVALTAIPAAYSAFTGWSGGCTGRASTCMVTMDMNKKVTATFKLIADLRLTNTDAPDPVQVGKTLAYTVVVTNLGPNGSSGIKVNDVLPLPVTYQSATPTQGSIVTKVTSTGATKVIWTVGALGVGASATMTVRVTPRVATTLTNTPSVKSSKTFDPVSANNKQRAVTSVVP